MKLGRSIHGYQHIVPLIAILLMTAVALRLSTLSSYLLTNIRNTELVRLSGLTQSNMSPFSFSLSILSNVCSRVSSQPNPLSDGYVVGRLAVACNNPVHAIDVFTHLDDLRQVDGFWLGKAYELNGQHSLAITTWKRFDGAMLLVAEGRQMLRIGAYEAALASFQHSLEVCPSSEGWTGVGEANYALNQMEQAKNAFLNALGFPGTHHVAYSRLGDLAAADERWEEACVYYSSASKDSPGDSGYRLKMILAQYHAMGNVSQTLAQLEQLVATFPDDVWGYLTIGRLYSDRKSYNDADKWFQKAYEEFPTDFGVYAQWGFSMNDRGNYQRAILLFSEGARLRPGYGPVHLWLATSYFHAQDCQAAREELQRVIQLSPRDAGLLESVGDLYAALGDLEDARTAYNGAMALDPTKRHLLDKLLLLSDQIKSNCK